MAGASIGKFLAWPFLAPGNAACDAMGIAGSEHRDLVRMLINSLVWMVVGIAIVIAAGV
jgi:hypothetical protein